MYAQCFGMRICNRYGLCINRDSNVNGTDHPVCSRDLPNYNVEIPPYKCFNDCQVSSLSGMVLVHALDAWVYGWYVRTSKRHNNSLSHEWINAYMILRCYTILIVSWTIPTMLDHLMMYDGPSLGWMHSPHTSNSLIVCVLSIILQCNYPRKCTFTGYCKDRPKGNYIY